MRMKSRNGAEPDTADGRATLQGRAQFRGACLGVGASGAPARGSALVLIAAPVLLMAAGGGRPARADVWDQQTLNDNTAATANELVHGSDQLHDLGAGPGPAADEDWYWMSIKPYSSYEVVVDGVSGDVGPPIEVDRVMADGTLFGSAVPIGVGFSRSMRFHNPNPFVVEDKFIRVKSGGCTTSCTPSDVYRLRFYETTTAVPRFNDAGTQVTVLILQNPTDGPIAGSAYFWNVGGTLLAFHPFTVVAHSTLVLNTATVPGLPGQSGTITVGHDGRYGDLSGKAVALEPATGFSFDSPMGYRPR